MKKIYKKGKLLPVTIIACCLFQINACKKFIEVDPPVTSVTNGSVFLEDATAASALTSIYAQIVNTRLALNLTLYPELAADNLKIFSTGYLEFTTYYTNSMLPADGGSVPVFWKTIYPYVYQANAAIEGLTNADKLTPSVKQNLLGEIINFPGLRLARFMRRRWKT